MINTLKLINYKQCFDSLSWYFFVKYVRSCSRMNDIPLYFLIVKEVIHKIISDKIATHTQLSDKLCHNGSNEERDFFYVDNRIVFNFPRRKSTEYPMLHGNYKGFLLRKIMFMYIILYNRLRIAYKSPNCDWCQVFESTCKNFVRSTVGRTRKS